MLLYTIVPTQQLLMGGLAETPPEYELRQMHNSFIQGTQCGNDFRISRLISTDPRLYLDPRLAPGELYFDK